MTQTTPAPFTGTALSVQVTIPADADGGGDADTATITASLQGDNTVFASAVLTTTALPVYGAALLLLLAWRAALILARWQRSTLTLTNTGNITDTFDLTYTGNLWQVTLPVTQMMLVPGASCQVEVQASVPASAVMARSSTMRPSPPPRKATRTSTPAPT